MHNDWKKFLDSPIQTLLILRLFAMMSMVGSIFLTPGLDRTLYWLAMIFFVISYLCIRSLQRGYWIFFLLEGFMSFLIGVSSADFFPYQLLIGLVGCGFFLYYDQKILYISAPIAMTALLIWDLFSVKYHGIHLMINYSFIIFACLTGGLIRYAYRMKNHSQLLYQKLEVSYQQLKDHTQTVKQLALEEERNRIAREIHDTVGHTVTALIVQLEGARKWMDKNPQKSKQILQTVEELARSIYQEIRFSIERINHEDWDHLDLAELCEQMLADFAKLTKLKYTYDIKGKIPSELPSSYPFHLYRVLQETLTNAKRHGKASHVSVELKFEDQKILLQIEDNGIGSEVLQLGFGLKNMQRRVEDLGGGCRFETRKGGGFRTFVWLPIPVEGEKR